MPLRRGSGWAAPAVYGVFFLSLFLAGSTALESMFVLPKAIVLGAGVLALGVFLLVRMRVPNAPNVRDQGIAPPRWALLLSLAIGAWWIISTRFALHLPTALHGEYNRYNGLWTHLCWLALFFASLCIPRDAIAVRRIVVVLVAAVVPVAAVNIVATTGWSVQGLKEISTLGDRVAASALMNVAIPFVVLALIRARHWGLRAALAGMLALLLVSEFLSQGRGPWMGLVAAAIILAAGLIRSQAGWKVVAAMLLALALLAGLTAKLSPAAAERFATLTRISQDESLHQRFMYYRAALRALREHPVAGIGFDNFRNAYPAYRAADDTYFFQGTIPTMVHNGYLQLALTNGIPALALYLALVAGALIALLRRLSREKERERHDLLLGLLAALSAYLVQDLVGWLDMSLTSSFWILLGLALNLAAQDAPRSSAAWTKPVIGALAGSMLLLSLYLFGDRTARAIADTNLYQAQALDVRTQWPQMQSLVNKALSSLPNDSRTEMVAGQLYATRFASLHESEVYAKSRALLESSYRHNSYDRLRLYNIVALESTALELGQLRSASDFALQAIATLAQTDADNPGFHALRAWFFAAQERYSDALAAIRDARRLAPQDARLLSRELDYAAKLKR